jgi:hypothetical protein
MCELGNAENTDKRRRNIKFFSFYLYAMFLIVIVFQSAREGYPILKPFFFGPVSAVGKLFGKRVGPVIERSLVRNPD